MNPLQQYIDKQLERARARLDDTVDWSLSNTEICKQYLKRGNCAYIVKQIRQERGIAPHVHRSFGVSRSGIDWETVDWSKSDAAIARAADVSHQAVQQQRRNRGIRPIGNRYDFSDVNWGYESVVEVARRKGCFRTTAYAARRRHFSKLSKA